MPSWSLPDECTTIRLHDAPLSLRAAITDRLGHTRAKRIRKTDESKKTEGKFCLGKNTHSRSTVTSGRWPRQGMGSSISLTITPAKITT
jgi:hypothetical protein